MAKKAKKTAARRKSSRKPARRRVRVKLIEAAAAVLAPQPKPFDEFKVFDCVRFIDPSAVTTSVGVIAGVNAASTPFGEPSVLVRFRDSDGGHYDRFAKPSELTFA